MLTYSLNIVYRLLNINFTLKPFLLPIQGCDVAFATSDKQASSISRIVKNVRAKLLKVQFKSLCRRLLVDAFSELRLTDSGCKFFRIVCFGFKKSRLLLQEKFGSGQMFEVIK